MRFLIDECLTIDLVSVAHQAGHEAQHVAHVGKAGWEDWNVVRHAAEGDLVVVTNNASDFRRHQLRERTAEKRFVVLNVHLQHAVDQLANRHAGLVIIIPSVNRESQADIQFCP